MALVMLLFSHNFSLQQLNEEGVKELNLGNIWEIKQRGIMTSVCFCVCLQSGELEFMKLQGHIISLDLLLVRERLPRVGPAW